MKVLGDRRLLLYLGLDLGYRVRCCLTRDWLEWFLAYCWNLDSKLHFVMNHFVQIRQRGGSTSRFLTGKSVTIRLESDSMNSIRTENIENFDTKANPYRSINPVVITYNHRLAINFESRQLKRALVTN